MKKRTYSSVGSEHLTHNQEVAGSSPAGSTKTLNDYENRIYFIKLR